MWQIPSHMAKLSSKGLYMLLVWKAWQLCDSIPLKVSCYSFRGPNRDRSIETSYLNAVTDGTKITKSWSIPVKVNGKSVSFAIDRGLKSQLCQKTSMKSLANHNYINQE